jgi:hypothetical protein
MVTEAMEQEHHHDHNEDEEATEDALGSTVILGKGKVSAFIYYIFIIFILLYLSTELTK